MLSLKIDFKKVTIDIRLILILYRNNISKHNLLPHKHSSFDV